MGYPRVEGTRQGHRAQLLGFNVMVFYHTLVNGWLSAALLSAFPREGAGNPFPAVFLHHAMAKSSSANKAQVDKTANF